MSDADLIRAFDELNRAMWDPTAPLPFFWPVGVAGAFLMFVIPLAVGAPFGVIMARDAGLSPLMTAGLYFLSDLVKPVIAEPVLLLLAWLAPRVEFVGRMGRILSRASDSAGLKDGRVRGPLGLVLFSFSISPTSARAAGAAAGHGFISGWTLAIVGDMLYFGLLMATTLFVASVFGDSRQTIGAVAIGAWIVPLVIRHLRRRSARTVPRRRATLRVAPAAAVVSAQSSVIPEPAPRLGPQVPRKRVSHAGRRRPPSRGLHR